MRMNYIDIENGSASLEQSRREYEQQWEWRELERRQELIRMMYTAPSYRIVFSEMLPDGKGYMEGNIIYVPESQAYKFIFMNGNISDQNIQFAINHAIRKVNRFIDNYKA